MHDFLVHGLFAVSALAGAILAVLGDRTGSRPLVGFGLAIIVMAAAYSALVLGPA